MSIPAKPRRPLRAGEICYDLAGARVVTTIRRKHGSNTWVVERAEGGRYARAPALLIPLPDEHPRVCDYLLARLAR